MASSCTATRRVLNLFLIWNRRARIFRDNKFPRAIYVDGSEMCSRVHIKAARRSFMCYGFSYIPSYHTSYRTLQSWYTVIAALSIFHCPNENEIVKRPVYTLHKSRYIIIKCYGQNTSYRPAALRKKKKWANKEIFFMGLRDQRLTHKTTPSRCKHNTTIDHGQILLWEVFSKRCGKSIS